MLKHKYCLCHTLGIWFFFFLQILLSKELDKGKTAKDLTGIKYVPPSRP